ncbi:GNAT family N-acetyltransferase [Pseudoxanthomonas sp. Root630]|uniref:GNAT family N-acetyltransferase n=1 Tax=Pseudoxanthomonas sp. Root630 TaxID=1736574 RepID=UPI0007039A79|nr:GNAT family N-acetyltransferase [Pseudoxanthomonas sp. Root630]KRA46911.1 acetyltransferase [Pseudoxanthomonas sp. Root630]
MTLDIRRATPADLDLVAPLFDTYRVFYGKPSDPTLARDFIRARMTHEQSVILLALADGKAAGFTQLYPAFSSVSATHVWILNDLLVLPEARRGGVARALLTAAADFARADGALRLELETDHDNHTAQALYHAMGWTLYDGTLRYRLPLR